MQEVEPLEGGDPALALAPQKRAQQLSFHELRDEKRHVPAVEVVRLLRVVLNQDRAVSQLVELLGVNTGAGVANVPLRKKEFAGARNARAPLAELVHFSFPARAERLDHLVLVVDDQARFETERLDGLTMRGSVFGHSAKAGSSGLDEDTAPRQSIIDKVREKSGLLTIKRVANERQAADPTPQTMHKSLDQKLTRIGQSPSAQDFILADAKDADMAFGLAAPGRGPEQHADEARFRTLDEYRRLMRDVVRQGLVDIMLMSASSSEVLTIRERLFDGSHVTPAVRANDTTDIWLAAGSGRYPGEPSEPFSSTTIDQAMCGRADCLPEDRRLGVDLGLYSVTFNNDPQRDRATLDAYKQFRLEAEQKGFRHFLEVFAPNAPGKYAPADVPRFVNDHIVRTLAGVTSAGRPLFLKIPYFGPAAMEELASYDSSLVVGILGGSAGTTMDAFQMLWEAKRYGARVALYGRKINNAEDQLTFIRFLRAVADDELEPVEAVRAYHAELAKLRIRPYRTLADDLEQTPTAHAYSSAAGRSTKDTASVASARAGASADGEPDFAQMTQQEKIQWNLERWRKILD